MRNSVIDTDRVRASIKNYDITQADRSASHIAAVAQRFYCSVIGY